jgi:molybdopterin-binding protein
LENNVGDLLATSLASANNFRASITAVISGSILSEIDLRRWDVGANSF